jgi:large subunit ribosomal protein L15
MSLSLTSLPKIKRSTKIRVGRGIGSGKGKTSGRGVKGQKARTGHHSVRGFEGGQTPIFMRLPKKGFKNILKKEIKAVNISDIENLIKAGKISKSEVILKKDLAEAGLIKSENCLVKLIAGKRPSTESFKVRVDKYSKNAMSFSS